MPYDQTLADLALDITELLGEIYPRVSDLNRLRRKADRLGILLVSTYVKSTLSAESFNAYNDMYYAAEHYLELHRYDLVRHNLESLVHTDLHTCK